MQRTRFVLCVLAGALACAGSRLPEFARPTIRLAERPPEFGDVIAYRALERDDFRADDPPPQLAANAPRVGAVTCGYIVLAPEAQVESRSIGRGSAEVWESRMPTPRFRAVMDRSCSWWNDANVGQTEAYVLQHEQIHFAIVELAARELNAREDELRGRLQTSGDTRADALGKLEAEVKHILTEVMQSCLARSTAFDEDTSFSYEPARQREWAERVNRELASSAP